MWRLSSFSDFAAGVKFPRVKFSQLMVKFDKTQLVAQLVSQLARRSLFCSSTAAGLPRSRSPARITTQVSNFQQMSSIQHLSNFRQIWSDVYKNKQKAEKVFKI